VKDQEPFYTLWQIVEKWANELKEPEIDVLQRLKRYSAYSTDGSKPVMIFWPTECFNAKGELNEITVFNANRLIKGTTQTKFSEDSYAVAVNLMNSGGLPKLSVETENAFNQFAIRREDFEKGCLKLGLPLPRFWFQRAKSIGAAQGIEQAEINNGQVTTPGNNKRKTHDNTGRKHPLSLMTTIDSCLQAFYLVHGERRPGGKSAISEFVDFIDERYKAQHKNMSTTDDKFMENIVDLKVKSRGDSKRFICLRAKLCDKHPKGQHWHSWHSFENQFGTAMKNFTPIQPPAEKKYP